MIWKKVIVLLMVTTFFFPCISTANVGEENGKNILETRAHLENVLKSYRVLYCSNGDKVICNEQYTTISFINGYDYKETSVASKPTAEEVSYYGATSAYNIIRNYSTY